MKAAIRGRAWGVVLGAWVAAAGCRTVGPAGEDVGRRPCGRVIRVNPADRYVVLECGLAPPVGASVDLMRDGQVAARVRATAMRWGPYVAADVEQGDPAVGDVMAWTAPRAPEADR